MMRREQIRWGKIHGKLRGHGNKGTNEIPCVLMGLEDQGAREVSVQERTLRDTSTYIEPSRPVSHTPWRAFLSEQN